MVTNEISGKHIFAFLVTQIFGGCLTLVSTSVCSDCGMELLVYTVSLFEVNRYLIISSRTSSEMKLEYRCDTVVAVTCVNFCKSKNLHGIRVLHTLTICVRVRGNVR